MRKPTVAEDLTVDGVINASVGWFTPSGEEDVDRPDVDEVLAP